MRIYILYSKHIGDKYWMYESTYPRKSDAWGDADFENKDLKWKVVEYIKGRTFTKKLDKRK